MEFLSQPLDVSYLFLCKLGKLSFIPLVATIVILYIWSRGSNSVPVGTKPLPGPWGLPYIGRVHDLDPSKPWIKLKEWSDQYNGFFANTMMGPTHLWIGDPKIAHDLLAKRAPIYSSRPAIPGIPDSNTNNQWLPLMELGEPWKRQRRFVQMSLTKAHQNDFYGSIAFEVRRFILQLSRNPESYYRLIREYTARISCRLCYGSPDDAEEFIKNVEIFIPHISPGGPITNLLPFLNHLPEFLVPAKREIRERREVEHALFKTKFNEVKSQLKEGHPTPQCATRSYLLSKTPSTPPDCPADTPPKGFGFAPDDHEATYAIGMLCNVAIETISGPLTTFLLATLLHPSWQTRLLHELNLVLGTRLATPADAPRLPTLRAAIKESMRWRPPVPLGVPRLVTEDNVYAGYFIPKGTEAHVMELALARNPALYPSAESFLPERWLEPAFPTYRAPLTEHPRLDGHHQFGSGWRRCPGVPLVEAEMLVACAALVQGFEWREREGVSVDPDRWTSNVIGGPLEFVMDLRVREGREGFVAGLD
ncbi:cytochrome P450 [Patellaria atrata CBS 101060]|uniref:Cytochrome P450 n=1 Tax=Patellaria atrata CBS 101060 TaxID=1346257 RepID=A0A9P4SEQ5_9PEZI|nr:cytochrome P450 [Patellaria atrata CBS 101060]